MKISLLAVLLLFSVNSFASWGGDSEEDIVGWLKPFVTGNAISVDTCKVTFTDFQYHTLSFDVTSEKGSAGDFLMTAKANCQIDDQENSMTCKFNEGNGAVFGGFGASNKLVIYRDAQNMTGFHWKRKGNNQDTLHNCGAGENLQ